MGETQTIQTQTIRSEQKEMSHISGLSGGLELSFYSLDLVNESPVHFSQVHGSREKMQDNESKVQG